MAMTKKLMPTRSGFTLIEALLTVLIIGILASISLNVFGALAERGRDARRKSDLTALSLGFQARYDSKTCSNPLDIGLYPGWRLFISSNQWQSVSAQLPNLVNDCGPFSEFLATIPAEPKNKTTFPYLFDLSSLDTSNTAPASIVGKHYRLIAHLERPLSLQAQADLDKMVATWSSSFGGAALPTNPSSGPGYNYMVGK